MKIKLAKETITAFPANDSPVFIEVDCDIAEIFEVGGSLDNQDLDESCGLVEGTSVVEGITYFMTIAVCHDCWILVTRSIRTRHLTPGKHEGVRVTSNNDIDLDLSALLPPLEPRRSH